MPKSGGFKNEGIPEGDGRFETAGVRLGSNRAITSYYFVPDENGEDRLYWIETGSPSGAFGDIVAMHKNKYGDPSSHTAPHVQNGFLATFENDAFRWDIGQDVIIVKRFEDTMQKMSVSYFKGGLTQMALNMLEKSSRKNIGPM